MVQELKETSKTENLAKKCQDILDSIFSAVDIFYYDEKNLTEQQRQLIREFTGKINPDNLEISTITLTPRQVRDKDIIKYRQGDDPGIHIAITTADNTQIHINAYGGLRRIAEQDYHDTNSSQCHSERTDNITSQATQVNVHINNPNGEKIADCWLVLGPSGNEFLQINNLSITTDDGIERKVRDPITHPDDNKYTVKTVRNQISNLCGKTFT